MTPQKKNIEQRLDILTEELSSLKTKTADLEKKIALMENFQQANFSHSPTTSSLEVASKSPKALPAEEQWSWVDSASLLPQIAAVCFILVVALVLRTLTDNDIINKETGSFLGMAYSAILISSGWKMLSRGKSLGRVFPVCGSLLLYSVVWETHARFESISSVTAYIILFLTLLSLTATSLRFKLAGLNCLGLIGTCIVAVTIDFPNPHFPSLLLLLWTANILAYMSSPKGKQCSWSRWVIFSITVLVWLAWSSKMRVPLRNGVEIDIFFGFPLFFPLMAFFVATYMGMSLKNITGKEQQISRFDMALPTLNVLWAYAAALLIVSLWMENLLMLGVVGVLLSILHFTIAIFLFWRSKAGGLVGPGICVFTFAGATLLVLALPAATGNILFSIVLWSALGLSLAQLSGVCEIGGIRVTSYLLQVSACGFGILSGSLSVHQTSRVAALFTAGFLMIMSGFQYRWCREKPIACSTGFFNRIDPNDRSAVLLLAATLINCFVVLKIAAFILLSLLTKNIDNALLGAQSVFINIGAIILMLIALPQKNKELMGMAIIVVIIGALKVFGYDLFESHGVPIVMSVFSFGAVAAAGSAIIKRWQNMPTFK